MTKKYFFHLFPTIPVARFLDLDHNNGKSAIYVGRAKNPSGAPFSVQLQANLFISATGTTSL